MQAIEVGKLLQEGKTRYPEVPKFDFDQAGGVLYSSAKSSRYRMYSLNHRLKQRLTPSALELSNWDCSTRTT